MRHCTRWVAFAAVAAGCAHRHDYAVVEPNAFGPGPVAAHAPPGAYAVAPAEAIAPRPRHGLAAVVPHRPAAAEAGSAYFVGSPAAAPPQAPFVPHLAPPLPNRTPYEVRAAAPEYAAPAPSYQDDAALARRLAARFRSPTTGSHFSPADWSVGTVAAAGNSGTALRIAPHASLIPADAPNPTVTQIGFLSEAPPGESLLEKLDREKAARTPRNSSEPPPEKIGLPTPPSAKQAQELPGPFGGDDPPAPPPRPKAEPPQEKQAPAANPPIKYKQEKDRPGPRAPAKEPPRSDNPRPNSPATTPRDSGNAPAPLPKGNPEPKKASESPPAPRDSGLGDILPPPTSTTPKDNVKPFADLLDDFPPPPVGAPPKK